MRTSLGYFLASFTFMLLAGCGGDDKDKSSVVVDRAAPGPLMRSGENCLSCHREGGAASRKVWTAAGTVFQRADSPLDEGVEGVTVQITDGAGKSVSLVTNAVGNFYTPEPLALPLRMAVERDGKRKEMPIPLQAQGACNGCHSYPDAIGGAAGRIRVP